MKTLTLAILLVSAILLPPTAGAQTLLFKSGFENNTVLGAQQVQSTDSWQYFSGTDTSTGHTWPMSFWPASSAATGIHLIHYAVPGGMTAQQLMNNTIVSMTGHTGATTNVLQMEIDNWNAANGCCAQDWLQVSGLSQSTPLRSYYLREWVQLYPNAQSQMNANLGNWFHSMWAIKTSDDFRIEAYLYGHNSNTGMFHVQADCNTGSSWCGSTGGGNSQGQYWSYDNTSVAIPFGQWFLMEIYLNRGTPTDGSAARFYWAVNGHTVFDIRGTSSCPATGLGLPTCFFGKTNQETNLSILGGLYGDSALNQTPFGEWIDDIEIWNQPPCTTLPCGSGSTTATVQPPANLTAVIH